MRDKEVAFRENDSQIRDLKEKVFGLSSLLRKSEMQRAELVHQVKSLVSVFAHTSLQTMTVNQIVFWFACRFLFFFIDFSFHKHYCSPELSPEQV